MAHLKMSDGNLVFGAIFLVSYVTGITGTVDDYAAQAARSFADVPHMRHFDLTIRSNTPSWYHEGMQLFAWDVNGFTWGTDTIKWGIKTGSKKVPRNVVEDVFRKAFEKWRLEIPKDFQEVPGGYPKDGIRISFRQNWYGPFIKQNESTAVEFPADHARLDIRGIDILIDDNKNWANENGGDYHNLRFAALHEIGHVLGLADSDKVSAVMYAARTRFTQKGEPILHPDDVAGIQSIYGSRV